MLENKMRNFKTFKFVLLFGVLCLAFLTCCFAQEEFLYDAKGKRDPFIPLVTPDGRLLKLEHEGGVAGLSLEGIIYDKNGTSCAIVNSEIIRIGDKVGEYQVLKIEEKKVIFIKEGQIVEVELKKEEL